MKNETKDDVEWACNEKFTEGNILLLYQKDTKQNQNSPKETTRKWWIIEDQFTSSFPASKTTTEVKAWTPKHQIQKAQGGSHFLGGTAQIYRKKKLFHLKTWFPQNLN